MSAKPHINPYVLKRAERMVARMQAQRSRAGGVEWSKAGRGHHFAYHAELDGRRLEVRKAPPLYGKWMIQEFTGKYEMGHFKQERVMETHAYAGDLREAKRKTDAVLHGESVEHGADKWRNPFSGRVERRR